MCKERTSISHKLWRRIFLPIRDRFWPEPGLMCRALELVNSKYADEFCNPRCTDPALGWQCPFVCERNRTKMCTWSGTDSGPNKFSTPRILTVRLQLRRLISDYPSVSESRTGAIMACECFLDSDLLRACCVYSEMHSLKNSVSPDFSKSDAWLKKAMVFRSNPTRYLFWQ